jgi:transposase
MAKKYRVTLTQEERDQLQGIIGNRLGKSPVVKKAYVLLAADESGLNWTDKEINVAYKCSIRTIERLRERFVEDGFEVALHGKPRQGAVRLKFDGRVEAQLIALRCGDAPCGHNKWTLELLADHLVALNYVESISREQIRLMLKKTNLSLGR